MSGIAAAGMLFSSSAACEYTNTPNEYTATFTSSDDLEAIVNQVDSKCGIEGLTSTDTFRVTMRTEKRVCIPGEPKTPVRFAQVTGEHGRLDIVSPHFVYLRSPSPAELNAGIDATSHKCGGTFVTWIKYVHIPPRNEALLGVRTQDCYATEVST